MLHSEALTLVLIAGSACFILSYELFAKQGIHMDHFELGTLNVDLLLVRDMRERRIT